MKPALVDTDILSMYFRGHKTVTEQFDNYRLRFGKINISIITYYEILSGLKHRDAKKQLQFFLSFANQNTVLHLTEHSAATSSEIYAELRKQGHPIDDIDLLIAGIALSYDLSLATNNENHFKKIQQLNIENWSKEK